MIRGREASCPAPLCRVWISEYHKAVGSEVNYTPAGSGDGLKSIRKRMVGFVGSDKPLKPKSLRKSKLYMFPIVVDLIVLSYNTEGVKDGEPVLVCAAAVTIFSGRAKRLNYGMIAKDKRDRV